MGWSLDGDDLLEGHFWKYAFGMRKMELCLLHYVITETKSSMPRADAWKSRGGDPWEHSVRRQRLHCSSWKEKRPRKSIPELWTRVPGSQDWTRADTQAGTWCVIGRDLIRNSLLKRERRRSLLTAVDWEENHTILYETPWWKYDESLLVPAVRKPSTCASCHASLGSPWQTMRGTVC